MPAVVTRKAERIRGRRGRPGRVRRKTCVVVGIGNPLMKDDGVGIKVARSLRKLNLGPDVLILERQVVDISIIDYAKGASKLVLVDALKSGGPAGRVVKFTVGESQTPILRVPLTHEQGLQDLLVLAREGGTSPPPIVVVGVEPADCTLGESLSEQVAAALPRAIEEVEDEVEVCARRRNR